VVLSADGIAAQLVSKYRPPCPVVVVSDSDAVLRGLAGYYALYPCKVRRDGPQDWYCHAFSGTTGQVGLRQVMVQGLALPPMLFALVKQLTRHVQCKGH
jgi:hypothetical protein